MKTDVFFIGDFQHLKDPLKRLTGEFEFEFFPSMDDMSFFTYKKRPMIILTECENHINLADGKRSLLCSMVTKKLKAVLPETVIIYFGEASSMENCTCAAVSNHVDLFFEKTADPEEIYKMLKRVSFKPNDSAQ